MIISISLLIGASYCVVLYYITLNYVILYDIISYHIIYHIISYYTLPPGAGETLEPAALWRLPRDPTGRCETPRSKGFPLIRDFPVQRISPYNGFPCIRQITPPTKNGHAPPPIESRKNYQSVNPYMSHYRKSGTTRPHACWSCRSTSHSVEQLPVGRDVRREPTGDGSQQVKLKDASTLPWAPAVSFISHQISRASVRILALSNVELLQRPHSTMLALTYPCLPRAPCKPSGTLTTPHHNNNTNNNKNNNNNNDDNDNDNDNDNNDNKHVEIII